MFHKSSIRLAGLLVILLSVVSLLVHLYLASSSSGGMIYNIPYDGTHHIGQGPHSKKLWGPVGSLEDLQPYAIPRNIYSAPIEANNGFIFAKIYGGFDKIQSSICDLVTISRLLNATVVIPEIQGSTRSKGISAKFKSFSYLYDEDQFIAALANDVVVVKSLPKNLKEARKKNKFPLFQPDRLASPSFYTNDVLPKLKEAKAIGLIISGGGCLQSTLPQDMADYQRLRCRVSFHALQFRPEIQALGRLMVHRLRATGQPYLAYHPGLVRERLAFHGCAELFQDVHTELIQYERSQMIKQGIIHEELSVDSWARKRNGTCPLLPEEVGILLKAVGYPSNTIVYVAGSETFGGQRILIPLRAMYTNMLDRTSLCTENELLNLFGPESPLPSSMPRISPPKSKKDLSVEWSKAGPRPRPLPPPPARPLYEHEKEGWYGWVAESNKEPEPSPLDLRMQAHRLLWDALDYYVSVAADAFFPGFNGGSMWPDFSSLVMGHRLFHAPASVTYRPDRKTIAGLFDTKHNRTASIREHLQKSVGVEGLMAYAQTSKSSSFLSHPMPECSCRTSSFASTPAHSIKGSATVSSVSEEKCPKWMMQDIKLVSLRGTALKDNEENESADEDPDMEGQMESDEVSRTVGSKSSEQDEEVDPDD